MIGTDQKSSIIRAAEIRFSAVLETRNRLLDENSAASRWMMATLATLNAGGVLGVAGLNGVENFWKIIAISMLCFGVLFAILLGYVTVLAVQSLAFLLNDLADEWMKSILTEEIDGDRLHELQRALIQKATPWKVASHVFGWLSLISFFMAVSGVAIGLK